MRTVPDKQLNKFLYSNLIGLLYSNLTGLLYSNLIGLLEDLYSNLIGLLEVPVHFPAVLPTAAVSDNFSPGGHDHIRRYSLSL